MSALSPKKRPRILRSGESAVECSGRSFDVAFIYPFSTLKKTKQRKSGMGKMCVTDSPGWQGAPEAERREKVGNNNRQIARARNQRCVVR